MKVSRRRFGFDSNNVIDVVNLKLPTEMFGSFGSADGVYPAYHVNKQHWISVILPDAQNDLVEFLTNVSFEATKTKKKKARAVRFDSPLSFDITIILHLSYTYNNYFLNTHRA